VSRQINDLRWKAEPKFVAPASSSASPVLKVAASQPKGREALPRELQHVRTYVELEMWELARQRATAIAAEFPDAPEAAEARRLLAEIEAKARPPADAKAPGGPLRS